MEEMTEVQMSATCWWGGLCRRLALSEPPFPPLWSGDGDSGAAGVEGDDSSVGYVGSVEAS